MRILKQSTAYHLMVFMTDSADHVSGKTGLTLTITASKAGAAFAAITPTTTTDRGSGWYDLLLTTGHVDTLGDLAIHVTGTGADPTDLICQVIAFDPADAVRLGLSALPNAAANAAGGLAVIGAAGQGPGGQIKANSFADNRVYASGRLTSCRMRVFANKAAADAATDGAADNAQSEVERYTITATYNTDGTLKTYECGRSL